MTSCISVEESGNISVKYNVKVSQTVRFFGAAKTPETDKKSNAIMSFFIEKVYHFEAVTIYDIVDISKFWINVLILVNQKLLPTN